MIAKIINIFRDQAKAHKAIQAFYYNRNYELGSGKEKHPLFWLEDPISGHNKNNIFINSVNFTILFIPDEGKGIPHLQNLAFSIGLNIIERLKRYSDKYKIEIVPDWSYTVLRDYYDNKACGCRFSVNFTQLNIQDLCLIDEQFDEDKEFLKSDSLNDFDINPANNCEIFVHKLPEFDLKTSK